MTSRKISRVDCSMGAASQIPALAPTQQQYSQRSAGGDPPKAAAAILPLDHAIKAIMPESWVRASMVVRANSLAYGASGVQHSTITALLTLLEKGVTPIVPLRGSISASGDLSPLSYIASVLEGKPSSSVYAPGGSPDRGSSQTRLLQHHHHHHPPHHEILHGGTFQAQIPHLRDREDPDRRPNPSTRLLFAQCTELINPGQPPAAWPPNLVAAEPEPELPLQGASTSSPRPSRVRNSASSANPGRHARPDSPRWATRAVELARAALGARYTLEAVGRAGASWAAAHLVAVCQALDLRALVDEVRAQVGVAVRGPVGGRRLLVVGRRGV